jgi:hypothetical protein
MPSIDMRTRTADDVALVDAADFFERLLPALIAERAGLAVRAAREFAVRPISFRVERDAWTVRLDGDSFVVDRGDENATAVVVLSPSELADIVNDLLTPIGLLTGGDLDMPVGRLEDFLDWWVVLRALLDGRAAHTTGAVELRDTDGAPLDLGRSFTIDDILVDAAPAAQFLAEAGFLHLRGVFDDREMAAVSAEMDAAMPGYTEGDGHSWWATTTAGDRRLVRMQAFHARSAATAGLLTDDRLLSVARLTDDGHRLGKPGNNPNLVEALVKPIGVIEGISDVPWHKDCSLGSHSYRCCSLTVGVSVTGADAGSGQLRVVAGSHRALIQPAFVRDGFDLPVVDLPTRTGDVTIHCSCTLHMSQPPVMRERRVLYTDFSLPSRDDDRDPAESNLKRIRDGAYTTVSQQPGHTGAR